MKSLLLKLSQIIKNTSGAIYKLQSASVLSTSVALSVGGSLTLPKIEYSASVYNILDSRIHEYGVEDDQEYQIFMRDSSFGKKLMKKSKNKKKKLFGSKLKNDSTNLESEKVASTQHESSVTPKPETNKRMVSSYFKGNLIPKIAKASKLNNTGAVAW